MRIHALWYIRVWSIRVSTGFWKKIRVYQCPFFGIFKGIFLTEYSDSEVDKGGYKGTCQYSNFEMVKGNYKGTHQYSFTGSHNSIQYKKPSFQKSASPNTVIVQSLAARNKSY